MEPPELVNQFAISSTHSMMLPPACFTTENSAVLSFMNYFGPWHIFILYLYSVVISLYF